MLKKIRVWAKGVWLASIYKEGQGLSKSKNSRKNVYFEGAWRSQKSFDRVVKKRGIVNIEVVPSC